MPSITYRRASLLDAPDLLRWKNDPVTRQFAIATHAEITPERHALWMEWALANPDIRIYIIECDGHPCGDVRTEMHASYVEIAIKLDKDFRGRGIGTHAITTIGALIQDEFKKPIFAKIVYGNTASLRMFRNCGYVVYSRGEGHCICLKAYTPISKL